MISKRVLNKVLLQGTLPNASSRRFSPNSARLDFFSEELRRWEIPIQSKRQKPLAVTAVGDDIHVLTSNPTGIHSFCGESSSWLNLNEVVPYSTAKPQLSHINGRLALFLPDDRMIVYFSYKGGKCSVVQLPKVSKGSKSSLDYYIGKGPPGARLYDGLAHSDNMLVVAGGSNMNEIDCVTFSGTKIRAERYCLPIQISKLELFSPDRWLVHTDDNEKLWMKSKDGVHTLTPIDIKKLTNSTSSDSSQIIPSFGSSNKTFSNPSAFVQLLEDKQAGELTLSTVPYSDSLEKKVLLSGDFKDHTVTIVEDGSIQVITKGDRTARVIHPTPVASGQVDWVDMSAVGSSQLVTLQKEGGRGFVRLWELNGAVLKQDMKEWTGMVGSTNKGDLLSLSSQGGAGEASLNPPAIDTPKHGKEDPNNTPHVGGNTWAGGTGGSNTAGLGGRGGPYRLDKGHAVHQVTEEAKREVDEGTKQRARELNRKAFQERLQEIEMSESEHDHYMSMLSKVENEVQQLRTILDSAESRKQERVWLKNQSYGDIDDSRLVDGVTGERLIYKRRGIQDPQNSPAMQKPKRLQFVVDCSGSMYRFNGQDGRLQRECELVVMVMEALEGFHNRFEYSIVGHSGEDHKIVLVPFGKPPRSQKEKLQVCLHMMAHSQYCYSGDMTLEATEDAISTITEQDADEYFVFVVSDANLRRYGIAPRELGEKLNMDSKVHAFVIFIAGFGEEATRTKNELPAGKGFVVLDTADLPLLFREILITNVIN